MRVGVVLAIACGCGRLGFDSTAMTAADASRDAPGGGDAPGSADASGDAPAGSTLVSFGERTGSTHMSVTIDTGLSATQQTFNYGAEDSVTSSPTSTGLVRFDLSALPTGTTVDGATLHLAVDTALASGTAQLYAVLESWTEGTAMGAAGVANYTTRTAGTPWTTAGAAPPGSRATTLLASFTPAAVNTDTVIPLSTAGIAQVQAWIDGPSTNFGFAVVVASGGGAWAFITRETTSANLRPQLELSVH
ncbi:MAG: DNRLRE domain-containing protein [Acidobacteriota bacterium]